MTEDGSREAPNCAKWMSMKWNTLKSQEIKLVLRVLIVIHVPQSQMPHRIATRLSEGGGEVKSASSGKTEHRDDSKEVSLTGAAK